MRLCSLISIMFFIGLLTMAGGVAFAQELDSKWLAGTWKAATRAHPCRSTGCTKGDHLR